MTSNPDLGHFEGEKMTSAPKKVSVLELSHLENEQNGGNLAPAAVKLQRAPMCD